MRKQRTREKTELQMEIEPMTFRTLVGCSTTEPRELIWGMTHGLYHTIT